jgi:calcineurin-like phosphoesterase family protein
MALFWTSDLHFCHNGALRFRPCFESVEAMNETIIKTHNSVVSPQDTVYYLGDMTGYSKAVPVSLCIEKLNGKKHWVPGNHDHHLLKHEVVTQYFESISPLTEIIVNGQLIVMCHYPLLSWHGSSKGAWMLHGHSHGNCVYPWDNRIMDVGVDTNDFKPYSFEDIKQHMSKRTFTAVDHHTEKATKPDDGAVQLV